MAGNSAGWKTIRRAGGVKARVFISKAMARASGYPSAAAIPADTSPARLEAMAEVSAQPGGQAKKSSDPISAPRETVAQRSARLLSEAQASIAAKAATRDAAARSGYERSLSEPLSMAARPEVERTMNKRFGDVYDRPTADLESERLLAIQNRDAFAANGAWDKASREQLNVQAIDYALAERKRSADLRAAIDARIASAPTAVSWAEALRRGADMPATATMVGNVNINGLPLDRELMTKQYEEKFGGAGGKYEMITSTNPSGKPIYLIVPKL